MKKQSIKNLSLFGKILLWSFGGLTALSIILSACDNVLFILNENQLLYLFSAMAQVIGGIFGLTLTAYVFFVDKFKESTKDDDTLYDATTTLLDRYFHNLILLAIICGLIILLCIIGIIDLHNWMLVYSFVINEGVFLFLLGIVAILIFGIMLLDSGKLDKEIKKLKEGAEKYYQTTLSSKPGDFRDFLKTYNLLSDLIIEFAGECIKEQKNYRYNYKPQIIQALNVLNLCEIINGALKNEIHELRMYRNGLVHGVDFNVTQDVCDRIWDIYASLEHAFKVYKIDGINSNEWKKAIKKIYSLSHLEKDKNS